MIYKKTINNVVYTAEYRGIAFFLHLQSTCGSSHFQMAERLFEEILVSPNVGIDDFADVSTFNEVYEFLYSVASGSEEKSLTKSQLKRRARNNWYLWRLVLANRGFDYQTVFGKPFMTVQDIEEANIALDMQIEEEKKATKRKR